MDYRQEPDLEIQQSLDGKTTILFLIKGENMSVIRLIMSDIDGTILDKNHQLDSHLIELIPLLKNNVIFCLKLLLDLLSVWRQFLKAWHHRMSHCLHIMEHIVWNKILRQHTIKRYSYYLF